MVSFLFGISILFKCFMCNLAKFHTSTRSSKPISQFSTFSTLRGNPECRAHSKLKCCLRCFEVKPILIGCSDLHAESCEHPTQLSGHESFSIKHQFHQRPGFHLPGQIVQVLDFIFFRVWCGGDQIQTPPFCFIRFKNWNSCWCRLLEIRMSVQLWQPSLASKQVKNL